MPSLARIRRRAGLVRTRVGAAVVVHAPGGPTAEARALAESLPADPDHELVVADVPGVSQIDVWKAVAAALPRGRRGVRVVPGQEPYEVAPYVWQWLADRVGRPVLAPYGTVNLGVRSLFVHSVEHSGWVSFRRGTAPEWRGKRFPGAVWDTFELGRTRTAGFRAVAEPLPSGMWLRPDVSDGVLAAGRAKLARTLPFLADAPAIVLGTPDAAELALADVAVFWRTLPVEVTAAARFVRFGEVGLPAGATFGQALADVLDAEVQCYTGIPSGVPDALEVLALRPDGSLGWSTFAQALAYRPRGTGAPRLSGYRPPVAGLGEVSPGVYWYAPEVVVEVVQAGLWIRPAAHVADPAGVRTTPLDPVHNLLLYEATEPIWADRLREAAETMLDRLDHATRLATRLMPSTALSGSALAGITPRGADRPTEAVQPPPAKPGPAERPTPAEKPAPAERPALVERPGPAERPAPVEKPGPAERPAPVEKPGPAERPASAERSAPVEKPLPAEKPAPPATPGLAEKPAPAEEAAEPPVTDLPWLSQLLETMSMPVPVRPADAEEVRADDRAD